MTAQENADIATDTLAFIDESGARGYSRKLTPDRDHEFGLVCALLVPASGVEEVRDAFRPGYERFVEAMPEDAKLHITDAFSPGNEAWGTVARSVRSEFYNLVIRLEIPVIYEARRLRVDRESHDLLEGITSRSRTANQGPIRVPKRPSQSRIEEHMVAGLSLKLDAFCEDVGHHRVDLLFDALDGGVAQIYRAVIERTRQIGKSRTTVKGWNLETQSPVRGEIAVHAEAPFTLHTQFLGELRVAGKKEPLVLAADIVANSLYDHLLDLAPSAPLNSPASIEGWKLNCRVCGAMESAIGDSI